jgi:hypothetical protein
MQIVGTNPFVFENPPTFFFVIATTFIFVPFLSQQLLRGT